MATTNCVSSKLVKTNFRLPSQLRHIAKELFPTVRRDRRIAGDLVEHGKSLGETQELLACAVYTGAPFAFGRPGGTESEGLRQFMGTRLYGGLAGSGNYSRWLRQHGPALSGLVHTSQEELDNIFFEYTRAILGSDFLGFGLHAPGALPLLLVAARAGIPVADIRHVEPFIALKAGLEPWTLALEGKRVLVIHPFCRSIEEQYARRDSVESLGDLLPKFELKTLPPPNFFASNDASSPWPDELERFLESVDSFDFDVALIAAGGFGLPIAAFVRKIGRVGIHVGGSLQLFFGIRGKRWDQQEPFQEFFGAGWVRPSNEETPPSFMSREGGVYW